MKTVLLAISTFAFLGTSALAQDNIAGKDWETFFSTYKAGTFAAIGKRKFAVHTEGNLERGYFETSATTVQFFICPSDRQYRWRSPRLRPNPRTNVPFRAGQSRPYRSASRPSGHTMPINPDSL
ncbi:hypothetical protein SAMN05428967_2870 [Phyllobacterium sp. YR620]|nr:hypothetical protein SAMN05428967_2870 [Phyllobacterium sp. YR620]